MQNGWTPLYFLFPSSIVWTSELKIVLWHFYTFQNIWSFNFSNSYFINSNGCLQWVCAAQHMSYVILVCPPKITRTSRNPRCVKWDVLRGQKKKIAEIVAYVTIQIREYYLSTSRTSHRRRVKNHAFSTFSYYIPNSRNLVPLHNKSSITKGPNLPYSIWSSTNLPLEFTRKD